MTLRSELLAVADELRVIPGGAGVADLGFRPTTATLVRRSWVGGRRGVGSYSDTTLLLTPTPRVRSVSPREVATSGGSMQMGDVRVSEITPSYGTGGYSQNDLDPAWATNAHEAFYRLTGEINGEFVLIAWDPTVDEVSFGMTLRRRATTPGTPIVERPGAAAWTASLTATGNLTAP